MSHFSVTVPNWFTDRIIRAYLEPISLLVHGRLLDLGCGRKPYRDLFDGVDCYVGLDFNQRRLPEVVASGIHLPFENNSFETVISNQVLEHIDDTKAVLQEVKRVLVNGGVFVFTVPFIARVHGAPNDYWRFSENGIRYLLESQGFEVRSVTPMGGFLTAQCYLWSFFIWEKLSTLRRNRLLRMLLNAFFALFNVICYLVHKIDRDTTTPFNYVCVGQK